MTNQISLTLTLIFACFLFSPTVNAQEGQGRNANASFALDFQTTSDDTQISTTIELVPQVVDNRFTVTLVLMNATDLVGVNCDLDFDESVLQVVDIREAVGDVNFDGRENIADVLTLTERLNASTDENGFSYFDLAPEGDSASVIDSEDISALIASMGNSNLFWTSNPDYQASTPIRESVEIFEDPSISNQNGVINDIVSVLLPRQHPDEGFVSGFGFDGDARIAEITFEIIDPNAVDVTFQFSDVLAIDEGTTITTTEILNASEPVADSITVSFQ